MCWPIGKPKTSSFRGNANRYLYYYYLVKSLFLVSLFLSLTTYNAVLWETTIFSTSLKFLYCFGSRTARSVQSRSTSLLGLSDRNKKQPVKKRVLALLFNHIVHGWRCNDCRNDIWKKLLNWIHERPWTGETPNTNASNFGDHVLRSDKGKVLSTEARKFAPALVLQTNIIPYHQNAGGVFTIRCLAVAGSKKQLQDQKHWCIRFYNTSRWLKNGIRAQGTFYTVDKKARMWVCEYKRQRERWSIYIDL